MKTIMLSAMLFILSCNNAPQKKSEIFKLSKLEIFQYLKQNNLVQDTSEITRETKKIEFPDKKIDPIDIKYYLGDKKDSLWIIHAYRKEYLVEEILFIKLSPKLKEIIEKEQNKRAVPKYDRTWDNGVFEFQ